MKVELGLGATDEDAVRVAVKSIGLLSRGLYPIDLNQGLQL